MNRWLEHWLPELKVGVATRVLQDHTVEASSVWSPDNFLIAP